MFCNRIKQFPSYLSVIFQMRPQLSEQDSSWCRSFILCFLANLIAYCNAPHLIKQKTTKNTGFWVINSFLGLNFTIQGIGSWVGRSWAQQSTGVCLVWTILSLRSSMLSPTSNNIKKKPVKMRGRVGIVSPGSQLLKWFQLLLSVFCLIIWAKGSEFCKMGYLSCLL